MQRGGRHCRSEGDVWKGGSPWLRSGRGAEQLFPTICSPKCQQTHLVPQCSFTKHPSTEARTGLYPWQRGQSRNVNATEGGRDSSLEGWFNSQVEMAALIYSVSAQLAPANFAPLLISSGEKRKRPDMLKAIRSVIDIESRSSWAP